MSPDTPSLVLVSFAVGIVIGLTGMGGGALMTPALIYLGVPPTSAVANDLVAAVVNKSVGAVVHWRSAAPHLTLAAWLIAGSVPTALAGAFIVREVGSDDPEAFLRLAIGITLLVAASAYVLRTYLSMRGTLDSAGVTLDDPRVRVLPTFTIGVVGGLLVGITSVGSGSVMMVALLLLYPALSAVRLVGTDLVQAIPLVVAAAISHVIVTGVDWSVLLPLVAGGTPGTFLGARLAHRVSQSLLRRGIAIVLALTGLSMLHVPPAGIAIAAAAFVVVGPLAWAALRMSHDLPPFQQRPWLATRVRDRHHRW
ncbi:sulfite exporter TauE/SafE family protein [Aeromicrobium sp.]|uniref:sulfite exporter TauE/SafE family protein n=1 Tax=Aeromicrobium sp. TaxID=1871063 RepID=UPI002FC97FFF